MARPTDDELEAMAVTMADYCLHDVAAMLRACKGRDSLAPAPDQGEWDAAIEAAANACISAIGGVTHYGSEPYKICAAAIRAIKKGQTNE